MKNIKSWLIIIFIFAFTFQPMLAREGVDIQYHPIKLHKSTENIFPLELNLSNFSGVPVMEVQVFYR